MNSPILNYKYYLAVTSCVLLCNNSELDSCLNLAVKLCNSLELTESLN